MIRRELLSMKKIILTAAVCLGGYVAGAGLADDREGDGYSGRA